MTDGQVSGDQVTGEQVTGERGGVVSVAGPPGVSPPLGLLNHRVAAAADAWLTDPHDVEVYRRLLDAVADRRRHLRSPSGQGADDPQAEAAAEPAEPVDEVAAVPSVGAFLGGDPRAVLDRLRRGG